MCFSGSFCSFFAVKNIEFSSQQFLLAINLENSNLGRSFYCDDFIVVGDNDYFPIRKCFESCMGNWNLYGQVGRDFFGLISRLPCALFGNKENHSYKPFSPSLWAPQEEILRKIATFDSKTSFWLRFTQKFLLSSPTGFITLCEGPHSRYSAFVSIFIQVKPRFFTYMFQ